MLKVKNIVESDISVEEFGGKAYGLSLLNNAGYQIPKTLVVQATDNLNEIDSLEFQNKLSEKLEMFLNGDSYDLAIRSSCTLEDNFKNSMAGHFDTFLGKMDFDKVVDSIKKIISGLARFNIESGKMGVIIQSRIPAEYSGVLFSSNPITYSKKQIIISYVSGIGDKLVSGEVSGIDLTVKLEDGNFLLDEEIDEILNEKLLFLARESKRLENLLHYPLDIEWALTKESIYFLQCRPLTSITSVNSGILPINEQSFIKVPAQLVSHDKIKLRLAAQKLDIFISDAYVCIENTSSNNSLAFDIPKSDFCRGYSSVIVYPQHLSNKVVRSFVGDKNRLFGSITDCCRYGIRTFPEYDSLSACLNSYFNLLSDEYWVSTTIIQEIFDPLYTGVIQMLAEGYIIEITKGHFLTKGVVPTSQYIVSKEGKILECTEIHQETWLKIIEGHVVQCMCDDEKESLVALREKDVNHIINRFSPVLKTNTNVVEFGLLKQLNEDLEPYLIDFVDDNSSINISSSDIRSGIISYGSITGMSIILKDFDNDSLNEHFHNISEVSTRSDKKIVFFCKNPELALLDIIEQYRPENIGFVFQNCAVGAHLAVVLREKGIPAIKLSTWQWEVRENEICTMDAETPELLPKERLKYE